MPSNFALDPIANTGTLKKAVDHIILTDYYFPAKCLPSKLTPIINTFVTQSMFYI